MGESHEGTSREDPRAVPIARRGVVTQLPSWMWLLATVVAAGLAIWCASQESWAGLIVSAAVTLMCGYAWVRTRSAAPS
jgi:hypothetical protein